MPWLPEPEQMTTGISQPFIRASDPAAAKASCASKIAMGVETGILGYNMYLRGNSFRPGDGIVGRDVEETIRNVGILASQGMKETDRVILKIMTE